MDVDGFHKPHQINRERKIQTKKMEEQKWKSGIDSLYNKIVKTSKTPATKSAK